MKRDNEMWVVDEIICRIIARADRWLTISLALDAWRAAELWWSSMEAERRLHAPSGEPKAAQAVPTVTNVGDGPVTSSTVRSDQLPPGTNFTPTDQLPIPAQFDRRKA